MKVVKLKDRSAVESILDEVRAAEFDEVAIIGFKADTYQVYISETMQRTKRIGAIECVKYELLSTPNLE